ncbi:MAG: filamentation induced by cAMP protein Fic [Gemmatimonadetes bacterium]|nr:filamentation induced by cAMP protein Fic [Gemmatimonadota bacterium]
MKRGPTGRMLTISTVGGETAKAFLPNPLPPSPALAVDSALRDKLDAALLALGRLDSVTTLLPDTHLFLYMYVRKEAVLSSQIEGTQSSLFDLLLFEADELPGVPLDDVTEVSSYVAALEHGLARIRDGFPLSNRLIREIHGILVAKGRGAEKQPSEFRRSQNWIGGQRPGDAAFVPPPPEYLAECMGSLERWIHDRPERTPPVVKAALSHVQFETIHPFLDGNGRVGRLLVTLLLCSEGVLREPLLYVSLFFKQHRAEYYSLLDRVRREGDWEEWLGFFAQGVRESAKGAVTTAQRLVERAREDAERIRGIKRIAGSALRVHHALQQRPLASATLLARLSGVSIPAVNSALVALGEVGIVSEVTGRKRNRLFSYAEYLRILSEGTEPLR